MAIRFWTWLVLSPSALLRALLKKYSYSKFDLVVSYAPNGVDKNEPINVEKYDGGVLTDDIGIVKFDKEAGEIDIEFGDDTALFTVDVTGQGKLNLAWNVDFNKEFAGMYDYANIDFVNFESKPSFNKTGTPTSTLMKIASSTK
ncbi:MAG: hypothetical protein V8Q30_12100 [Acutalibacteraceae bacterium]